jgi:hypothetical protein
MARTIGVCHSVDISVSIFELSQQESLPVSVSGARRSSKPQGRVRFPGGGLGLDHVFGV